FCCWKACRGVRLEASRLAAADRAVRDWRRHAILPLRALRRRLKADPIGMARPDVERLRRRVARVELEAARLAQRRRALLEEGDADGGEPERLAAANLDTYLAYARMRPGRGDRRALAVLSAACARNRRARGPAPRPSA